MRKPLWIVEPTQFVADKIIADIEAIRRINPQRFEMEQLTAVIYEDTDRHICVGYKDVADHEFWSRGHVPKRPILPPMLMCESAAQLASYYALKNRLYKAQGGLVGLKNIRCHGLATPGDRLFVITKLLRIRSMVLTCQFQCVAHHQLICDGIIMGSVFTWNKEDGETPKSILKG